MVWGRDGSGARMPCGPGGLLEGRVASTLVSGQPQGQDNMCWEAWWMSWVELDDGPCGSGQ